MLCHVFLRPRWLPCGRRDGPCELGGRTLTRRAAGQQFRGVTVPPVPPFPPEVRRPSAQPPHGAAGDLEPVPCAVLMLGPPLQLRAPERRSSDAGVRPQGSRKVPLRRSLRGEGKVHPTRKEIAGRQALRGEHLTPAIAKEGEAGAGAARAPPAEGGKGVELVGGRHRKRPH